MIKLLMVLGVLVGCGGKSSSKSAAAEPVDEQALIDEKFEEVTEFLADGFYLTTCRDEEAQQVRIKDKLLTVKAYVAKTGSAIDCSDETLDSDVLATEETLAYTYVFVSSTFDEYFEGLKEEDDYSAGLVEVKLGLLSKSHTVKIWTDTLAGSCAQGETVTPETYTDCGQTPYLTDNDTGDNILTLSNNPTYNDAGDGLADIDLDYSVFHAVDFARFSCAEEECYFAPEPKETGYGL